MKKLKDVKYFHIGNLSSAVIKSLELTNEKIVAMEIYDDGTIMYVPIKNIMDYIIDGGQAPSSQSKQNSEGKI